MNTKFAETAVKLSQGPLGIIALFIVLIHGFASLVLGLSTDIGDFHRTILVWFLVLFPTVVFVVFSWLVKTSHKNLYPPGAFRNERYFVDLAFGKANIDKKDSHHGSSKKLNPTNGNLNKSMIGNIYWLGHDLMWTADTLLRHGQSKDIIVGIDQSLHHLIQIGLGETEVESHLNSLKNLIMRSEDLPSSLRDECASQIGSIIDQVGITIETKQSNFLIPPHWNRIRN
jgi:hypothetical protein